MSSDIFGWDVGGAHVKVSQLQAGQLVDVAQWACPLWQGEHHLRQVLQGAQQRWPQLQQGRHAVTMTGEVVDLFANREAGVLRIAELLDDTLQGRARYYAGDSGWCSSQQVAQHWDAIASANWMATASHAALLLEPASGVLVDIGSTTTDLIAFSNARVLNTGRTDAQRLASGELVYHGAVRTPLCALGPQVRFRGQLLNVMNEFFATVADVYRLTGELNPAHDLYPPADSAGKDAAATRTRLARMIGMDAREASSDDWLAFAREWRQRQLDTLRTQLQRVISDHALRADAVVVSAGCGDFLVPELVAPLGLRQVQGYAALIGLNVPGGPLATRSPALAGWAQVCAPSVAVASLFAATGDGRNESEAG